MEHAGRAWLGLTLATLLATWPAAIWFKEPRMYWIVPLATVSTFVHSFVSSRVFTCHRHLRLGALLKLELGTQTLRVVINLVGAYLGYGLISLLIGQIVGSSALRVLSHFLPGTHHRDRWQMDPQIRHEVLRFGRWIFLSSALTVVATRGDSAMLGRMLGPADARPLQSGDQHRGPAGEPWLSHRELRGLSDPVADLQPGAEHLPAGFLSTALLLRRRSAHGARWPGGACPSS